MASNAEKLAILQSSTEPMVLLGYIKKDGSFRLVRARLDVPGKNNGQSNYDTSSRGQITVYDMDEAKKDANRSHRHLILDSIGWAIVNGILYDFRKPQYRSETNTNLTNSTQINNSSSGQVPINRSSDPDTIYSSRRKIEMIKISRTSRAIAVAINGMAYGNGILWKAKDILPHVPGDKGSVSDIVYIALRDLPKGENLNEDDVIKIMKQLQVDPSEVPSVVLKENQDGSYYVIDDAHRIEACRRLGISPIPARIWSEEEGTNLKRDLKNIREAFEAGDYPRPAELKSEGKILLNKFRDKILQDPEMISDAVDILINIPDFSMKMEWSHLIPDSLDRKKLEQHIGDSFNA
jgi:hypothetical protein